MSKADTYPVLQASGVSKRYELGVTGARTLGDELKRTWTRLTGAPDPLATIGDQQARAVGKVFWALRDISFTIRKGEVLGIVGRNGAGKSTLLKLFSRITTPTSGTIRIRGSMSSLLEVGTGFNPDLTGRENIYLNAAILGMKKVEIDRKLDAIIAFSGIQHHIDTPVKRYSSGMKVRLGFSVAAHLDPDIMVIDEVLAVGDAEFQRKCLGKMKDVSDSGRTVLFVSHNMTAIRSLCSRVIWLEDGRVRMDGPTEEVISAYLSTYKELPTRVTWTRENAPGNATVRLLGVRIGPDREDATEEEEFELNTDTPFRLHLTFENIGYADGNLNVGFLLFNGDDVVAFSSSLSDQFPGRAMMPGLHRVWCGIPGSLLNSGDYRVEVHFWSNARHVLRVESPIAFEVHEPRRNTAWYGRRSGVLKPRLPWGVQVPDEPILPPA